jgi:mannose-6-phosphate isomerase-like protein (cupin superfamily)
MRVAALSEMVKGWFVEPSVHRTTEAEVAVKAYRAGESEEWHVHRVATEITAVVSGAVRMCGQRFEAGAIVRLEPGEGTDFLALEDTVTVVVKLPSVRGDKYTATRC